MEGETCPTIKKRPPVSHPCWCAMISPFSDDGRPFLWRQTTGGGGSTPLPTITSMLMGQSEPHYIVDPGPFYRNIPQPTPGDGNLIVFNANGASAPTRVEVNPTTVANGEVNPAMAALSALLAYVRPGQTFVVGDGTKSGTSRTEMMDDSNAARLFSDFVVVVDAVKAEFGSIGHLVDIWYGSDASSIINFRPSFWTFYFAVDGDGNPFTLGDTNNDATIPVPVDHCLWDATALASEKGRGIFARSETLWHLLTPMPFLGAPVDPDPELLNFSSGDQRMVEPNRQVVLELADDAVAQSVGVQIGPSNHLVRNGASDQNHPDVTDPDGQILFTWPFAVALLRAAGMSIGEPVISAIEGPTDGSYADLVVDLPNGGTLTTLNKFRGDAYAGSAPHRQEVTGIELKRGSERRPVFNTDETGYPQAYRGTVVIQDSGSGSPKKGRVRITPTDPFEFGDSLSYIRGQGTAALLEPRDFNLYADMLIEHVPALYDATALYPFEGVTVRPLQSDLTVNVPAPPFVARGVTFDGSTYFDSTSLAEPGGNQGAASFWIKSNDDTWNDSNARRIFHFRVGSTTVWELYTASAGRLSLRMNQDGTGSDTANTPTGLFTAGAWQHVLWAWDYPNSRFQMYVNGVAVDLSGYTFGDTGFTLNGNNIARMGIGAIVGGTAPLIADLGHLWLSPTQTLDFSVQANREKFALAGEPVDLGANGQLPTGTAPEWYYDGSGAAWSNQGTADGGALTGTLTAAPVPPGY